jgi:hypothetical protein
MENGTTQIEDSTDFGPRVKLKLRPSLFCDIHWLNSTHSIATHLAAHLSERRTHGFHDRRPAEKLHRRGSHGSFKHLVDRWKIAKRRCTRGHDARPQ